MNKNIWPNVYVYIESTVIDNYYKVSCSNHSVELRYSIPYIFIESLLTDIQIKKLKKGTKRFEVEWALYYQVIIFAYSNYMRLAKLTLREDKYYEVWQLYTDSPPWYGVDNNFCYDSIDHYNTGRGSNDGRIFCKLGSDIIKIGWPTYYNYRSRSDCTKFQENIIKILPELKNHIGDRLEFDNEFNLVILPW